VRGWRRPTIESRSGGRAPDPQVTVAGLIAQALTSGQWSSSTLGYYLADNHPSRPGGSTTINAAIGPKGTTTPAVLRAFNAYSDGSGSEYGTLLGWTGKAFADANPNDPSNPRWWYLGGTTGGNPWSHTAVRYDCATDQFLHWQGSTYGATDGLFHPQGGPHNFGSACFDPATRRLYRITKGAGSPYDSCVGWFNVDTNASGLFAPTQYLGSTYASADFMPSFGAQGSVVAFIYGDSNNNVARRYDIDAAAWFSDIDGSRNSLTGACTSFLDGAIYFSFGDGVMYRLNADKSVTTVAGGTPISMNGGGSGEPNFCIWSPLGQYIYAFCDNNAIYRFDTVSQTWSGVVGTIPTRPTLGVQNYTVAPLAAFGVFMLVYCETNYTETALLWKP
jgi:hypothetical protein